MEGSWDDTTRLGDTATPVQRCMLFFNVLEKPCRWGGVVYSRAIEPGPCGIFL